MTDDALAKTLEQMTANTATMLNGVGLARMRNSTWPDWILAVPLSSAARAVAIVDGKPRFCGKVLVDTQDQARVGLADGAVVANRGCGILSPRSCCRQSTSGSAGRKAA